MPHKPIDTIQQLKDENYKLTILAYVFLFAFGLVLILAIKQRGEVIQYQKDIVMVEKDRADWEHKWTDFNKSYIPETALPRVPEIEAIYNEERK